MRFAIALLCSLLVSACRTQPESAEQVSATLLNGDPDLTLGPEVRLPARDVATNGQHNPTLSWDGARYLMAWRDSLGDIVGVWVEPDGTRGEGFLIGRSSPHPAGPVISRNDVNGEQVVFWIQPHAGDEFGDIAALTVTAEQEQGSDAGQLGGDSDAGQLEGEDIALRSASALTVPLAVASNGSGHVAMWLDDRPTGLTTVVASRFEGAGWFGEMDVSDAYSDIWDDAHYPVDIASDGSQYLLFWTEGAQRRVRTLLGSTLGPPALAALDGKTDAAWNGVNGYFLANTASYVQLDASGAPTTPTPMGDWQMFHNDAVTSVHVTALGADIVAALNLTNDWDGSRSARVVRVPALGALQELASVSGTAGALLWDGERPVLAVEADHSYAFYAPSTVRLEPTGDDAVSFADLAVDADPIDLAVNGDQYLMTWGGGFGSPSVHGLLARVEDSSIVRDDIRFAVAPPDFSQKSVGPRPASNGEGYLVTWRQVIGDTEDGFYTTPYSALLDANGDLRDDLPGDPIFRLEDSLSHWRRTATVTAVASDGIGYLVAFKNGDAALQVKFQTSIGDTRGADLVLGPSPTAVEAVWTGRNYLVVWETSSDPDAAADAPETDVKAARLTRLGDLLDPDGIWIARRVGGQKRPKIAVDGDGTSLIVWNDVRDTLHASVDGALVTSEGVVHPSMQIAPSAIAQFAPAVAWDGRQFIVAWTDGSDAIAWDVRARSVAPEPGSVLGDVFPIADSVEREYGPTLAPVAGKGALIAYHRAQASGREIGVRRLVRDSVQVLEDAGAAQGDAAASPLDGSGPDADRDGGGDATASDATDEGGDDDGACLCSAPGGSKTSPIPWLASLALLATLVWRRRHR